MPGDVSTTSARGVEAERLPLRLRDAREQHEERGEPDLVERVVAGAQGTVVGRLLPRRVTDRGPAEPLGLGHPHHVLVRRRVPAAGRVDVHRRHAALPQVQGELVGEPGRAAVPSRRVPGPPGDPERAPEAIPLLVEDAGELEQGRVADRVVADPHVPGVVVAVRQEKLIARAPDPRHGQLAWIPALLQPRVQRHPSSIRGERPQPFTVLQVHRDHRRPGLRGQARGRRRPPDRRADAPVDPRAGVHVDLAGGPRPLDALDGERHRVTLGDDDLAQNVGEDIAVEIGEQVVHLLHALGVHVHELRFESPGARRRRERRRLGRQAATVGLDPGLAWQGEV